MDAPEPDPASPKQGPHRFKPGQSGNPKGRAPGSRNRVLEALDLIGAEAAKDILEATINAAKRGNSRAAELLLLRLWPARKSRPVVLDLPPIDTPAGCRAALAALAAAVAAGDVAPDEAAPIAALIEAGRKAIETADLEERITTLEARIGL